MALTKAHNRMIAGDRVNVLDYGAVGDGTTDDTTAIQAAITAAANSGQSVFFPNGTYRVTSTITIPKVVGDYFSQNGLNIEGATRNGTEIQTDQDIVVFDFCDFTNFRHLTVRQTGTTGTGKAFYSAGQVRFCTWEDVNATRFKFGWLIRYSLWCAWRDIYSVGNTCGIRLARNDSMEDQTDPAAPGFWNLVPGWFHNQLTFDNVLCNGGEVGIWASCMGATFNNVTCQNQETDGSSNSVLPVGQIGTGMWLDGGGTGSNDSKQNVIMNYYTEDTYISLMVKNTLKVTVDGWFAQGESSPGFTDSTVLDAYRSVVFVQSQTGTSFWQYRVVAEDSTIVSDSDLTASGSSNSLTNSTYTPYGNNTLSNISYTLNLFDGTGNLATFATSGAKYSQTGNIITVSGFATGIDTTGLSGSDGLRISLPVAASSTSGYNYIGSVRTSNVSLPTGHSGLVFNVAAGATTAFLYTNVAAASPYNITVADFASGTSSLYFTVSYMI